MAKVVIGVYPTPEQFVADAMAVGRPSLLSSLLLNELLEAAQAIHRQGEGDAARSRMRWQWVSELGPAEDELSVQSS